MEENNKTETAINEVKFFFKKAIKKINKTKSWIFRKAIKLTNPSQADRYEMQAPGVGK